MYNLYKMEGFYRGLLQCQQIKRAQAATKQETKAKDKTKEVDKGK